MMAIPERREQILSAMNADMIAISLYSSAWMVWALVLKGREVRRGKERMKVADEYLAIREARLNEEFSAMSEKFLEEQQAWRAEKQAQLYEQIMDQQARGLLSCPTCHSRREGRESA